MRTSPPLGLAVCMALGVASVAHAQPKGPVAVSPQAGQYNCHMLGSGGMIMTPYGGAPTVIPLPSAIVRVQLDGSGAYVHASGGGRYRYDPASGRLIVESGPFAGWAIRSESNGKGRWLRFAATKGAQLAPTSRLGDHICSLT